MSTTSRKSAPKPVAAKAKLSPVPAPVDVIVTPDMSDPTLPEPKMPELKKKELLEMVLEQGDFKKKHAKPVMDAVLAALRLALLDGRDMVLPPLGKVKLTRAKDTQGAQVVTCRIRLAGDEGDKKPASIDEKPKAAPLAEVED